MKARRFGAVLVALAIAAAAPARAEDVRIGVGAPLSGVDSVFGAQILRGASEAVADVNAAGGILGRKAAIVPGDDGSDPKKGVEVAKRFVASGIDLVVGHLSSAVTMPASAVYAEAKALDITPSAAAPQITDRGLATVFRLSGRDDQQGDVAARFLLDRHFVKIAVLHDRSSVGKKLADTVRKNLAEHGVTAAFYGSVAEGTRDLGPLLSRLKATGAQIVFWGGGAQGAAQLVRSLKDARISLLGGTAIASDDFATAAGNAADGTFIVFPKDNRRQPAVAALVERLKAKKYDPDAYALYAYAAVQVIAQAAKAAGSLEPEALARTMHSGRPFQTVLGSITFDAKGDPTVSDFIVYVWRKGPSGRMEFLDPAAF